MNKLVLLGGALALASLAPPAYKIYHNQRFGYRFRGLRGRYQRLGQAPKGGA